MQQAGAQRGAGGDERREPEVAKRVGGGRDDRSRLVCLLQPAAGEFQPEPVHKKKLLALSLQDPLC